MISIASNPSSSNRLLKILLLILRRFLLVLVTFFIVTAITFYLVGSRMEQCSAYQLNSSYENKSENTFSILCNTFHAYVVEAFSGDDADSDHLPLEAEPSLTGSEDTDE